MGTTPANGGTQTHLRISEAFMQTHSQGEEDLLQQIVIESKLKPAFRNERRGVLSKGFFCFTITRIRFPRQPLFKQSDS
jgi:hypothetical protein